MQPEITTKVAAIAALTTSMTVSMWRVPGKAGRQAGRREEERRGYPYRNRTSLATVIEPALENSDDALATWDPHGTIKLFT
jgi:hypothetical protein